MQNSEVEFQHFQETRNEMVEIRSAISTAGQADVSQYSTVELGTRYPVRLFTINPPPPSGTLQTSPSYNIVIENQSGNDPVNVPTRFLKYQNGYNEMDIGPIWYEHSVLYLDERNDGGGVAVYQDQNIIAGDETTRVTALQNEFRVSSTGRVTLDLYPVENASINSSDFGGEVTIKIPSRLNGSIYWDEAIDTTESERISYQGTEQYPGEADIYWVVLTVEANALNFNTVGVDSTPESQTSAKQGVGVGTQERTGADDEPNPAPQCEPGNENIRNGQQAEDIAVTGDVTVSGGSSVNGDVIAGGDVTVKNGARVTGNIQAGATVSVTQGGRVAGDVSAGESVTENNGGKIDGDIDENIDRYSPCDG